jgi:hypothetical protein
MSLINDALKRAKQAQQENPPPTPPLQFRPVQPTQEGRPRSPQIILGAGLGLIVVVALGGLLLWAISQPRQTGLQVEARTFTEAAAITPAVPADPPPAPLSIESALTPLTTPEEAMTNSLPAVAGGAPSKVPELKLQGIFFNPRSPSAVVNGRTVYVGDKVSGFRVFAITPQAVTLATSTQTNVLSLSE